MIDLKQLFVRMEGAGLTEMAFADMNKKQMNSLISIIMDCVETDCCYKYICEQVPSYISSCKGDVDKCKRAIYLAQQKIPKKVNQ